MKNKEENLKKLRKYFNSLLSVLIYNLFNFLLNWDRFFPHLSNSKKSGKKLSTF